ncbi:MAG: NADH-quinone oxidoreductase subunit L, partial [Paracoccaceae bacterium]|nr:NADH-quinone oxidoreductase subunit L [Paracoccaceae bacterium]
NLIAFLLFIGAMGKSAQLFLHTWLPDAMEGPTPVSALIHAATMVTAGVFLVCRMSPLIEYAPEAKAFITVVGASTAFFAATVGLVQTDIKRVIAYSTCSQLGYMFVAAGVGVYSVAMFHLLTHAFFKAMLFLGAGNVIHAMHHEQDMRKYGGLRKKIPYTFWAMMIGTLAITGVGIPLTHYGFAGFLSKDAVIESAWAGTQGGYGFWLLVVAALFTSFYSWRLMFMTFFGEARGSKAKHENAHESPMVMLVPLGVLAIGAVFSGMVWYGSFFGDHAQVNRFFGITKHVVGAMNADTQATAGAVKTDKTSEQSDETAQDVGTTSLVAGGAAIFGPAPEGAIFMADDNHVMNAAHHAPVWVKLSPFIAMLLGFVTACWFYIWDPKMPKNLVKHQRPVYLFLLNKWYFDEIFDFLFVTPAKKLGRFLWRRGDGSVIDGTLNGVAMGIIPFFTRALGIAQSGYIFTYALAMVLGLVAFLAVMMIRSGGF